MDVIVAAPHLAPILCAGVTTYKGLKEAEAKPGEWVLISVSAVWATSPFNMPRQWGFTSPRSTSRQERSSSHANSGYVTANCATEDAVAKVVAASGGGDHRVLVTAASPAAFNQAIACTRGLARWRSSGCRRVPFRRRSLTCRKLRDGSALPSRFAQYIRVAIYRRWASLRGGKAAEVRSRR